MLDFPMSQVLNTPPGTGGSGLIIHGANEDFRLTRLADACDCFPYVSKRNRCFGRRFRTIDLRRPCNLELIGKEYSDRVFLLAQRHPSIFN